MFLTISNVVYVLVAVAMIVLILLQRGAGAAAGSGFGGGASATVFGARGSGNFLSRSTAVLATLFFAISLGMAVYANRNAASTPSTDDLGVMANMAAPAEVPASEVPELPPPGASEVISAPVGEMPAAEGESPLPAKDEATTALPETEIESEAPPSDK